ncbi:MarR family winged helix-turn-helix transcriptional regulator [Halomonas cerina]|uniref:DNA-binding MarR family transcriptional regulator n=1 Tax=Halomonas cerina TaxID=447424 RepID=A0A839V9Y5_9GAMM|nr:MarR family transcriptional regulator [Halomonas cerina]MBB3191951.1 DNA-binding MarR family transcriptional regulator [Halomonas cerina]
MDNTAVKLKHGPARNTTYLLAQTTNIIRNSWIDPALKQHGLTSLQYTVLSVIKRYSGLSSAELSRHFFVTPQTMGPILTQLEKRGLIVREPNTENRRLLAISLTDEGGRHLETCNHVIADIEQEIFGELDDDTLQHFRETLQRIYRRAQDNHRPR